MKKSYFLIFLIVTLSLLFADMQVSAAGKAKVAPDITQECEFTASPGADSVDKLHDGKHETAWTAAATDGQYVRIALPESQQAAGIYIMWNSVPENWSLLQSANGKTWSVTNIKAEEGFINAYIPIDSKTTELSIESDSYKWKMTVAEVKIYGNGDLPDNVQVWQPSPEKADLMVIPCHPDDELIYFGGVLPYYAGQKGLHTIVVYMTSSPMIRKFEALDGLWKVGVREYPVFLPLPNKYSTEIEDAEKDWGGVDPAVNLLVEQIRRFKPDVVVTHDLNGEYGHGQHKLTALSVEKAVDESHDPAKYPDSAKEFGVWQPKKCYLHLYAKNQIEMNWELPLSRFDGKTALDMAKEGYALHISQHFHDRPILDCGIYDNAKFGLYFSSVGADVKGGDLFENIKLAPNTPAPAPSNQSVAAPTKQQSVATKEAVSPQPSRSEPVKAALSTSEKDKGNSTATIVIVLILLAAAIIFLLKDHFTMVKARHAR